MKCIICEQEAKWFIKGTTTAYCEEHAHEMFSDTSYLASVEEEVSRLKSFVDSVDDDSKPNI